MLLATMALAAASQHSFAAGQVEPAHDEHQQTESTITVQTAEFYRKWTYPLSTQHIDESDESLQRSVQLFDMNNLVHINHFGFRGQRKWATGGIRILAAGCGTGNGPLVVSISLNSLQLNDYHVTCIDLSNASLAIARRKLELLGLLDMRVVVKEMDLLTLDPEVDGVFDLILCTGVLHHLHSPERGLAALTRVLAPGGAMALMLYSSEMYGHIMEMHRVLKSAAPPSLSFADRLHISRELYAAMKSAGLSRSWTGELRTQFAKLSTDACAEDDECWADAVLVPAAKAYSVREAASMMAGAGLCAARLEPSWRYAVEYADVSDLERRGTPALSELLRTPLDEASVADQLFHVSLNHAFFAMRASGKEAHAGWCEPNAVPDPLDERMVPVWVLEVVSAFAAQSMQRRVSAMLRAVHGATPAEAEVDDEDAHGLWKLVTPSHIGQFAVFGERDDLPRTARRRLLAKVRALPKTAADMVDLLDGCIPLTKAAARVGATATEALAVYRLLEQIFGLRLASRDGGIAELEEACASASESTKLGAGDVAWADMPLASWRSAAVDPYFLSRIAPGSSMLFRSRNTSWLPHTARKVFEPFVAQWDKSRVEMYDLHDDLPRFMGNGAADVRSAIAAASHRGASTILKMQELTHEGRLQLAALLPPHVALRCPNKECTARDRTVGAHLYVSAHGGSALPMHSDMGGIIVLQLLGEKLWTLGERPGRQQRRWNATLRAGDVLWLPPQTWHRARNLAQLPSMHLTLEMQIEAWLGFTHAELSECDPILENDYWFDRASQDLRCACATQPRPYPDCERLLREHSEGAQQGECYA